MDAVVLLHLTCLTVWPTLLESEKHSWGWRLCQERQVWWKVFQNHTHVSPHSSSSIHNHRRTENKYLQWAVTHCWDICRIVWYENIFFAGNFKMKGRKRREHFTRVHHCCSLSHNVVKALDCCCTVETLRWGLVSGQHTHTHTGYNVVNLAHHISLQGDCNGWLSKIPELWK